MCQSRWDRLPVQSPVPKNMSETQEARQEEEGGHLDHGPRIRLRVSRPKITLRLTLTTTKQAELGGKKKAKRRRERQGTQREKGKKGSKSEAKKGKG
jgi:hypothetical protein